MELVRCTCCIGLFLFLLLLFITWTKATKFSTCTTNNPTSTANTTTRGRRGWSLATLLLLLWLRWWWIMKVPVSLHSTCFLATMNSKTVRQKIFWLVDFLHVHKLAFIFRFYFTFFLCVNDEANAYKCMLSKRNNYVCTTIERTILVLLRVRVLVVEFHWRLLPLRGHERDVWEQF